MKSILTICLLCIATLVLAGCVVAPYGPPAAYESTTYYKQTQIILPPGNYQATCRNMTMKNGKLYAMCRTKNGRWVATSTDPKHCKYGVTNINGQLHCIGYQPAQPKPVPLPAGNYQATCRNTTMKNGKLYAMCRTQNGRWVATSTNPKHCKHGVTNINGQLHCIGYKPAQPKPTPLPAGNYQATCRNMTMKNGKLYAMCRTQNGRWVATSTNPKHCKHGVTNINGQLHCIGHQPTTQQQSTSSSHSSKQPTSKNKTAQAKQPKFLKDFNKLKLHK